MKIIYRILLITLVFLILFILGGTLFGKRSPDTGPGTEAQKPSSRGNYFTGIGRIRTASDDVKPATIIVSIAFPYDPKDSAFSEELASHIRDFRDIAVDFFSSYSSSSLRSLDEAALKHELLRRYNKILRLGKIQILYFNDFVIID
ncbi:hypothetical protein MASR2M78_23540 [Treponema sp.]